MFINIKKVGKRPLIIKKVPVVFDDKIYDHPKYKRWRMRVFKRDGFLCRLCGQGGNIEAHHIKKKSLFPELMFVVGNGIVLCLKCHREKVTGHEIEFEKVFQDMVKEI